MLDDALTPTPTPQATPQKKAQKRCRPPASPASSEDASSESGSKSKKADSESDSASVDYKKGDIIGVPTVYKQQNTTFSAYVEDFDGETISYYWCSACEKKGGEVKPKRGAELMYCDELDTILQPWSHLGLGWGNRFHSIV